MTSLLWPILNFPKLLQCNLMFRSEGAMSTIHFFFVWNHWQFWARKCSDRVGHFMTASHMLILHIAKGAGTWDPDLAIWNNLKANLSVRIKIKYIILKGCLKKKNHNLIRLPPIFPDCETVGLMQKYFVELQLPRGKPGFMICYLFHLNLYIFGVAPWTPRQLRFALF